MKKYTVQHGKEGTSCGVKSEELNEGGEGGREGGRRQGRGVERERGEAEESGARISMFALY